MAIATVGCGWQIAEPKSKKYKIFIWGPEGCFKTRTALRLGNVADDQPPATAMIDTEFGSDHYGGEFRFVRKQTVDPDEVFEAVKELISKPGNIKTLIIDSFSVYYESLMSKYVDLFLKREVNSAGNKRDYYVIQPRDYQQINREAYNLIRMLLACDLNVIVTCHAKDKWGENMKVEGKIADGPKKMAHYFDTIIEIEDSKSNLFTGVVKRKDRTHTLKIQEQIPWSSDIAAAEYISKAFGHDLSVDAVVKPGQAVNAKKAAVKPPKKSAKASEKESEPQTPDTQEAVAKEPEQAPAQEQQEPSPIAEPETQPSVPANVDNAVQEESPEPVEQSKRTTQELLAEVVALKRELGIVSKTTWNELLAPFKVNTAKELTDEQLSQFIDSLQDLRPM